MAAFSTPPPTVLKKPTPFKVAIPDEEVQHLKDLLKLSRLPKPTYESLQEDGRFGLSLKWMDGAKKSWEALDWKKAEAHMNSFPHFTTPVTVGSSTFNVHFVALFSEKPHAIPLAFFHGWPGNFLEFLPILTLLKEKYTPATLPYHIIVPSLIGYGFSSPPPFDRNFTTKDIAAVMDQLLLDLGFGDGYIVQGGDIGSRVSRVMGGLSESCKAVHLNFSPVPVTPGTAPEGLSLDDLGEKDRALVARGDEFVKTGSAYAMEHATRPATIGLALDSSPLALLAWIGEKFEAWSDVSPSLEVILESVSLYWFTESMGRGIFPYRGRFDPENNNFPKLQKPTGYSLFPKELIPSPKTWVAGDTNLVWFWEHEKGGHFAALEQPELLLADVEEFVKQVWKK